MTLPPLSAPDVVGSPERRPVPRRVIALAACVAVAIAVGAVALRQDAALPPPALPGWPAAGSRAGDETLRTTAWRAWAARDASVRLDRTAMLFAADWDAAARTVVLLAMPYERHVGVAVVLVVGDRAERFGAQTVNRDRRYVTEVVEVGGHSAVLAVAPGAASVVVTSALPGARTAEEIALPTAGGALIAVPDGRTATRVVVTDGTGRVLADRVPGADSSPQTPPAPLIERATTEGGRRVQIRTNGAGVRCRVTLADPATDAPTLVECPPG